jgi:hypothetical protein
VFPTVTYPINPLLRTLDENQPTELVTTLLRLLARDLEWLGPEWQGFRFYRGELLGPSGAWITLGIGPGVSAFGTRLEVFR